MNRLKTLKTAWIASAAILATASGAMAENFNIPAGDLKSALDSYMSETGVELIYPEDQMGGLRTKGVAGSLAPEEALTRLLKGTGFSLHHQSGAIAIVRDRSSQSSATEVTPLQLAQAAPSRAAVETVTVTSSKLGGADVQSIPIAITALSQEQLTASQTNGGPDLIKQVPNMTFTKTNFSGYSISIRGIGTQAISVTTDPAVAVAFNDIPFIRNHFFEQEFYDVAQVEVLRGPQGTLYGRNATAGVVNLTSAKPTDQFEAMASAELGNYHQKRFEGMVNIPIVDDRLDIRVAGEWTKRQGYSFNTSTDDRIDGRDLWSGRVTIGMKPTENLQMYLVWEHFSEDDDRMRSAKQLCKTDYGPGYTPDVGLFGGVTVNGVVKPFSLSAIAGTGQYFLQGCKPESLYSPQSFEVPLPYSLPYVLGLGAIGGAPKMVKSPYPSQTQSPNLRVIQSSLDPIYKAKNDVVELNADYALTPALTLTSQTGFSHDFLYSAEDYNRFGSVSGVFGPSNGNGFGAFDPTGMISPQGVFCDPQLGCSDQFVIEDLSQEHAWQLSQEFRLASNFNGPFNFSAGGNYLHYETEENYYVFSNVFTMIDATNVYSGPFYSATNPWIPGVSDNSFALPNGFQFNSLVQPATKLANGYIDPNPLSSLNDNGHNYFLSKNPYVLNSYALFGEAYYNILDNLKLTAGLRWTEDQKHFPMIPSWLVTEGWGYPVAGVINQQWDQFTGRAVVNWTPKLAFTDQTLIFGSYAHGYKAGGANPPGAVFTVSPSSSVQTAENSQPVHPLTFKPEFIDAFELGSKNTLLDGALTLNGSLFYYNYENYQVSEIVDRTAINQNFDAHAKGAEIEATWEPIPGLRFNFGGGWEDTAIAKGQSAVDLMDRTAGHSDWYVVKPFVNEASNCIFPGSVAQYFKIVPGDVSQSGGSSSYCSFAYNLHVDPITGLPYTPNPVVTYLGISPPAGYVGYDPANSPNNGAGFSKDLSGNKLPNAPPFTASFGAQYSLPLTSEWAGTMRADGYWQDSSWWRVFNDMQYDKLHGYATMNLTLILTSQSGWQVMLYDKNVFNTTAITGAFLNSDDSGLTTNVFLTDPKLLGIRVTKNW